MQIIKVAIVENEELFIEEIRKFLKIWCMRGPERETDIKVYYSGEEILEKGVPDAHILFMDIELDGYFNGIETARRLRQNHYKQKLVFLTAYSEYALEGYKVEAMDYLLKPVKEEDICGCMDRLVRYLSDGYYTCRMKEATVRIPFYKIRYCFSALHNVEIFTENGTYRHAGSLDKMRQVLPSQFIRCHRTAIINLNHVTGIKGNQVFMSDGVTIPVSGTYIAKVRRAYLEQML